MKALLVWLALLTFAHNAVGAKKPKLKGDLFKGHRFKFLKDFSDEFRAERFDLDKWYNINPRWKGRQPGLFATKNVKQRRGELRLRGRYEKNDEVFADAPEGYEKYTTAFVMTRKMAKYGYFEVRAKPSNSRLSSAFWGSLDTPTLWTEIDVFEIGGGAVNNGIDYRKRINMNLHVFRDVEKGIEPRVNEINKPTYYTHTKKLRSKFNTYGVDWSKRYITWTFNGRAIRRDRNRYWKQAFPIKFDVETMPYWFGLPSRNTLPATYKIKYIRAWSRKKRKPKEEERTEDEEVSERLLKLGNGLGGMVVPSGSNDAESEVDDGDDDDDDDAETEIEELDSRAQTNAPVDGLQRPPVAGSNERVYDPVLPIGGGSWNGEIRRMNEVMEDVSGSMIDEDEDIFMNDFDGELVQFARNGNGDSGGSTASSESESGDDKDDKDDSGNKSGLELPVGLLGRPDRPSSGDGSNGGSRGFGRVAGGVPLKGLGMF
ncbi:Beta-porphyranase A [Gracilariopsis chorda]|uniref:Beta-porphyranase A n=1 Tax=Gracilariopsis chorda TaxID=448386 RepID=A0A2V3IZ21_9FLOR|nr:Beta-porphyranase A [Gracilariopsis chorda]|eukprot:PXF47303.1 Beta-porphyranase A [Gracilariopsis chorda]